MNDQATANDTDRGAIGLRGCKKCRRRKPMAQFPVSKSGRRGWRCETCKAANQVDANGKMRIPYDRESVPRASEIATTCELFWAAGFIEGEGSFIPGTGISPLICVPQVNREPLERLQRIFGGSIRPRPSKWQQNPQWQDQYLWRVGGCRATGIALTLYCLMSEKRQAQIRVSLALTWERRNVIRNI
jgi:hypothetical protein